MVGGRLPLGGIEAENKPASLSHARLYEEERGRWRWRRPKNLGMVSKVDDFANRSKLNLSPAIPQNGLLRPSLLRDGVRGLCLRRARPGRLPHRLQGRGRGNQLARLGVLGLQHPSAKWDGQLGKGKSHSNVAGTWSGPIAGNVGGDWYCYTPAEDSKLNNAVKIWINPIKERAAGQSSYPYDEDKIQTILRDEGVKKPETALRLGQIGSDEELLIPAASLPGPDDQDGGRLLLQTFCFAAKEEMLAHMAANGITATEANYEDAIFTSHKYGVTDQTRKRATIDEGEGEAVARPARLLRFMRRDPKGGAKQVTTTPTGNGRQGTMTPNGNRRQGTTTPNSNGKQGTTASGSSPSSDTLPLAEGYTITLKKDPKAKRFPARQPDTCLTGLAFGPKPKVIASPAKKPNTVNTKPNTVNTKPKGGK
ncbi:hypothetical protein MAPG_00654 [Magnaporthiopsis poae ATCC 64411]|uniref:Uncharacterized protein n=1 Tax=Magnaporthiopsis poae (strain ATCC 64411 / 73-15) TaxID=644358 RepID=A0A0C4DLL0_MAGP6|nr:hypothetical protein MAPG_00654 [Magnaporthiopsis poae ATCC 64411]